MAGTFGQALARRYILGESLRELAVSTGYSTESIRRWLRDEGVELRSEGGMNSQALADPLEQARQLGETETCQYLMSAVQDLSERCQQFAETQAAARSDLMNQFTDAIEAHYAAMSSPPLAGKCTAARNDLMRHLQKAIVRYAAKRLGLSEEETAADFEAKAAEVLAQRQKASRQSPTTLNTKESSDGT